MAIELEATTADVVVVGGITLVRDSKNPLRRTPHTGFRIDLPRDTPQTADSRPLRNR
jgi:hypothetical protein